MRISLTALCLLIALPASAGSLKLPTAILVGVQAVDLATTHTAIASGRGREANPFAGPSDVQRIALKAATTAGTVYLMQRLSKSHPRAAQVTLYAVSGAVGFVAMQNVRVMR